MNARHLTAAVVAGSVLAMSGCAQTGPAAAGTEPVAAVDPASIAPELRMSRAFTTYGFEYLGSHKGMISPQDTLKLAMIAKQRAIAQLCDGFEVDEARYSAVMNPIVGPLIAAGSPAGATSGPRVNMPFTIAMSGYSVFLGGNLAVGAYDPEAMCAFGEKLRKKAVEDGKADLLIWKAAN